MEKEFWKMKKFKEIDWNSTKFVNKNEILHTNKTQFFFYIFYSVVRFALLMHFSMRFFWFVLFLNFISNSVWPQAALSENTMGNTVFSGERIHVQLPQQSWKSRLLEVSVDWKNCRNINFHLFNAYHCIFDRFFSKLKRIKFHSHFQMSQLF